MTSFHYSHPESSPRRFGDDVSKETLQALTTVAMGPSIADDLLADTTPEMLEPEVRSWVSGGFEIRGGFVAWARYRSVLDNKVPGSLDELAELHPNLNATLERLQEAEEAMRSSGAKTQDGVPVGRSMELVLVPWQALRNNLDNLPDWLKGVRSAQGAGVTSDALSSDITDVLKQDKPLYRSASRPRELLTPKEYLDAKIASDGPWGVMLAQTGKNFGYLRMDSAGNLSDEYNPNMLTRNGDARFQIAGYNVDGLGLFEWLAITMQADPKQLSPISLGTSTMSWFLGNRFIRGDEPVVPVGYWSDGINNLTYMYYSADHYLRGIVRPRLAVL